MIIRLLAFLSVVSLIVSCSSGPESEEHRSAIVVNDAVAYAAKRSMVDVRKQIPDVVCDLRYATKRNVTGQLLYPADMPCLLFWSTADKLKRAQALLRAQGYGLKIWDAWRPPEVQVSLFEFGGHTGMFVDPKECWSKHCSGVSVDVTLVDAHGNELPLPTYFDEGGPKAHYIYQGNSEIIRKNVKTLQDAMTAAGFSILINEWWHFDDAECSDAEVAPPPVMFASEAGIKLPPLTKKR